MNYDFLSVIDAEAARLDKAADDVWDTPELAFTEFKSAATLIQLLKEEGFEVEENLANIKTAFSGRYGSGHPVVGVLGEFDALSGLGQVSECSEKKGDGNVNGHGCGHNNLGVGSVAAAMAIKKYLQDSGAPGTVIFYGCPGEEGGSGKAFMARDGVFDELDVAVSWHPSSSNAVRTSSSLANYQILFKFDGIAAHAAGAPHMGRSALDGLEIMNNGVQYLREHVIDSARIHYAITDAGGISPNVVQPHAEALYLIRAPRLDQAKEIYERVLKVAAGAAMMTETTESHEFIKACSNLVMNDTLQRVMQDVMEELTPPAPSEKDIAFAKELAKTMKSKFADPEKPLDPTVKPYNPVESVGMGSTDVGDVSWCCPLVQMRGCTWAKGTPGHSWQAVAQGKTDFAHEQTRYAGKVMALTMVKVMQDPALLEKATEEFKKRVGPDGYIAPIPKDVKPRALTDL